MPYRLGKQILGHSSINITMNLYVHVTDDEKIREIKKFEGYTGKWRKNGVKLELKVWKPQ